MKATGEEPTLKVTVRGAVPGDERAIETLYRCLTNDPNVNVDPDRISQIASNQDCFLFVAESDGQVVGTAFVSLCPDAMYGYQPFAVIENVVVDSGHRNRGIGAALMLRIEALSVSRDCSKSMLLSSASRSGAHAFFRRMGYAPESKVGFIKYRRHMQP